MAPGYGTNIQERPRSTDPTLNALIDELFPVQGGNNSTVLLDLVSSHIRISRKCSSSKTTTSQNWFSIHS